MDVQTQVNIFAELIKAATAFVTPGQAKFKPQQKREPDSEFLERLLGHLAELPDESYNKLSEEAQHWFQVAGENFNASESIPEPAGFESAFLGPKETPVVEKSSSSAKEKPAAVTKEKPAAVTKERSPRTRSTNSVGHIIRRAVISNPSVSFDEVTAMFKDAEKQPNPATIASFISDCKATLEIAEELGYFKRPK